MSPAVAAVVAAFALGVATQGTIVSGAIGVRLVRNWRDFIWIAPRGGRRAGVLPQYVSRWLIRFDFVLFFGGLAAGLARLGWVGCAASLLLGFATVMETPAWSWKKELSGFGELARRFGRRGR